MIGLLSAFPLPKMLQEKLITAELEYMQAQSKYFKQLTPLATPITITPDVYVPVFEPDRANLVGIFIESGAAHLVFKDEVAPTKSLDENYRETRREVFGRAADVESVEFTPLSEVLFKNNYSGMQLYETSLHYASVLPYPGAIYSNTWNHLLSARPCLLIKARGGYKKVEAQVMEGAREDAEEWAKAL